MPNEIIRHLWLGDGNDAQTWPNPDRSLCVLESGPVRVGQHCIPILAQENGIVVAKAANLDRAADFIRDRLLLEERFLVHCGAGIERSPLTVAWFLVKKGGGLWPNMNAAYAHIIARRPEVQDRQAWLERQP
jgi:protein-tyrosine phosphatase